MNETLVMPQWVKTLQKPTIADHLALQGTPFAFKGFERGYNQAADVITEAADGVPLNQMWDEFQRTIQLWNQQRDPLTNILTYRVTRPVEGIRYPTQEDFEEASEFGEPKGIRLGPLFKLGFGFKWWDLAIRYTWMFLAESDSAQIEALNNSALEADNRLMFTRVMRQVFNSTTATATIDDEAVNVYPFYNGDAQVPPRWKTIVHTSGHTHYLVSGGATVDSGDLDAIEEHLYHHGYMVSRGNQLVILVNRQEGAVIRTFTVAGGDKYDFIPSAGVGGGVILPNGTIIGRPGVVNLPGLITVGTYGAFTIVEEDYVPAGYMVGLATGGEDSINNPVGIREHERSSLRGVRLVKGRDNDYPLVDSFYQHGFGTGIRHRGAGVVMQVKASGSYDIPSIYA